MKRREARRIGGAWDEKGIRDTNRQWLRTVTRKEKNFILLETEPLRSSMLSECRVLVHEGGFELTSSGLRVKRSDQRAS